MNGRALVGGARRRLALGTRYRALQDSVLQGRYAHWRTLPVLDNVVLYESFSGNGMLDNPEAIFRYLLDAAGHGAPASTSGCSTTSPATPRSPTEFADHPRVRFVEIAVPGLPPGARHLEVPGQQRDVPPAAAKRPEQVYVNTWHGAPLKHMGYDMPEGGVLSRNIIRNFLNADYLLSANAFMTDTMYRSAYRHAGHLPGRRHRGGPPAHRPAGRGAGRPGSGAAGGSRPAASAVGDRKIVLYAPTWRGASFQDPHVNAAQLMATVRADAAARVDARGTSCCSRCTRSSTRRARAGGRLRRSWSPTTSPPTWSWASPTCWSPTTPASSSTSSPPAGRCCTSSRTSTTTAPAAGSTSPRRAARPACRPRFAELVGGPRGVARVGTEQSAAREAAAATYAPRDDGSVCARVVDLVFRRSPTSPGTRVRRDFGTEKERLLIYLGAMKSMGITTSALNLLRNLDYDRYDVTAFFVHSRGRDRAKNIALDRPPGAGHPPRADLRAGTRRSARSRSGCSSTGLPDEPRRAAPRSSGRPSGSGCSGTRSSTTSSTSAGTAASRPSCSRSPTRREQEHLAAQRHVRRHAARDHRRASTSRSRLNAVFTTYRHFDHLVSVSPELEPGQHARSSPATRRPEQFTLRRQHHRRRAGPARWPGSRGRARQGHGQDASSHGSGPHARHVRHRQHRLDDVELLEHFTAREIIREARSRARIARMSSRGHDVRSSRWAGSRRRRTTPG